MPLTQRQPDLTARQQRIKDEFIAVHRTWDDAWEDILRLDPEFLEIGRAHV